MTMKNSSGTYHPKRAVTMELTMPEEAYAELCMAREMAEVCEDGSRNPAFTNLLAMMFPRERGK